MIMKNAISAPIAIALIAFSSVTAFGQKYKTAAGVRFDRGFNFTVQQYIHNGWTAEGILHTPLIGDNMGVTVLAEKHRKILFRGTNFYTGLGAHYYWNSEADRETGIAPNNVYGISGIGGLEFTLGRIVLSADWKPELHLNGGDDVKKFNWNGASVSARYIIEKRERRKVKDWKIFNKNGGKNSGKNSKKKK